MAINLADLVNSGLQLWVSGKSYAKGDQAISGVDLCTYIRKVAGAGATDPASDTTNWQPFGARPIKSIQRGETYLNSGESTLYVTIAAVNMSKCELRYLGSKSDSTTDLSRAMSFIRLYSATQIMVGRYSTNLWSHVSWELTEYY